MTDADSASTIDIALRHAASAVRGADALLFTAGAGMGVDSGLPDFRGPEGFWRAYPPYRAKGLHFQQLANQATFSSDPHLAWGFYGHRLNLYRSTRPHPGFDVLLRRGRSKPGGCFVFTSNVDGHFHAAGFPENGVAECHGSIHRLQCTRPCRDAIWPAQGTEVSIDANLRAVDPLPHCPRCGALARPNILLFDDFGWIGSRTEEQETRYHHWISEQSGRRITVIECGAGNAIPTVRHESEAVSHRRGATLVRINPREPEGPTGTISLPLGAMEAIRRIDGIL